MTFGQYESAEGISKHGLDSLAISPLHHWAYHRNPERVKPKDTPAKIVGNAIHVSILEPKRFEKEYIQEPDKKDYPSVLDTLEDYKARAKERGLKTSATKGVLKDAILQEEKLLNLPLSLFWDDIYEQKTFGRTVLSQIDWRIVKAITSRVRKHPAASELFKEGKAEQSIFWVDKETGVQCKGRIDWITNTSVPLVVDLKSTTDASLEGFQRSISKYRYYVQAAMYIDGLEQITNSSPIPFVFAAWEKHTPYASALYYATKDMIEAGRQEYRRLLRIYADCLSKDNWPGYSQEINPIDLPASFKPVSSLNELEGEDEWLNEMIQE